ncbi:MAG: hypothetical protein AAFW68_00640 [Pseudomonadota bacterium]
MAVVSNPADFAATPVKLGAKTGKIALYLFIGVTALGISVAAAMMSSDIGLFDECYSACAAVSQSAAG